MLTQVAGRCLLIGMVILLIGGPVRADDDCGRGNAGEPVKLAVEFMDHAAAAFISREKGWFEAAGLNVKSYETYVTGMSLASALARGDIDAAYICLVPAVNAYKNAGVPLKIVAGTHKHGYGLVTRGDTVSSPEDLRKPGVRIGCVREGGAVDVLLRKTMDEYGLAADEVLPQVQRMPPAKQVMALQMKQLEAVFLPEQWATMAESGGGRMMLTSRDVWPRMQGSVLVVKEKLIREKPEVVRQLTAVLCRATAWINRHPREAAVLVAGQLRKVDGGSRRGLASSARSAITPGVLARSMARMDFTTAIDPGEIQKMIDYMGRLGYIRETFPARDILDLRFLNDERDQ